VFFFIDWGTSIECRLSILHPKIQRYPNEPWPSLSLHCVDWSLTRQFKAVAVWRITACSDMAEFLESRDDQTDKFTGHPNIDRYFTSKIMVSFRWCLQSIHWFKGFNELKAEFTVITGLAPQNCHEN